jgi:putative hemolysin
VVGGGLAIARLNELTGIDLAADLPATAPEGGVRNVSDWIVGHLKGPVRGGDIIERGGVRVVVRKVRRQKVLEAQIGRVDAATTA